MFDNEGKISSAWEGGKSYIKRTYELFGNFGKYKDLVLWA